MHATCDKLKEQINLYRTDLKERELLWTSMVKNPLTDIKKMLGDLDREYDALLSPKDALKMRVHIKDFSRRLLLAQGIDFKTGQPQPQTVREHVAQMTSQAVDIKVCLRNGLEAKLHGAITISRLLKRWKQVIDIHAVFDKLREFIIGAKGKPDDAFWGHVERQCFLNHPKISIVEVDFLDKDNNDRAGALEVYIEKLHQSVCDLDTCVKQKDVDKIEKYVQEVVTYAHELAIVLTGSIEDWFLKLPTQTGTET
jgi:hypothetical protein